MYSHPRADPVAPTLLPHPHRGCQGSWCWVLGLLGAEKRAQAGEAMGREVEVVCLG